MKAIGKLLLLTVVLTLGLCVSAMAAEAESGIYNVTVESTYSDTVTVVPQQYIKELEKAQEVTKISATINNSNVEDFYPKADVLNVTYTGAVDGSYYLILALDENDVPKESNIKYIDQKTASSTSVSFDVYPSSLENDNKYYIYLLSNDEDVSKKEIASFQYGTKDSQYLLGDVDLSQKVDVGDVTRLLQYLAKLPDKELNEVQMLAADADRSGKVDVGDATKLLQYIAKLIPSL